MIAKCVCHSAGQDKLHGPGYRVMNQTAKPEGSHPKYVRCTICGRENLPTRLERK